MATQINPMLKAGLLGNAIFSLICGLVLIVTAADLAEYLGGPDPNILKVIGIGLLPFAVHLLIALRRENPRIGEIYYLSAMDGLWVLASGVVLATGLVPFTAAGVWMVGLVALVVADFMAMQLIGARRMKTSLAVG